MKSLKEKFEAIDVIFQNHKSAFIELEERTPVLKKFKVLSLKDNSEEIDKIAKEVNAIIKEKTSMDIKNKQLDYYNERLSALSKEFVKKAEILCKLEPEYIEVTIQYPDEQVVFKYKDGEYLDSLLDYLEKDMRKKLIKIN